LREPIAAQHFDHRRNIIVVNRVAPIGQHVVDGRRVFGDTIFPCYRSPGERECTRAEGLLAIRRCRNRAVHASGVHIVNMYVIGPRRSII
jgi:hypothetical protein